MKVKYATIIVADMQESVDFYTRVLGLEVDSRYDPLPGVVITLLRGQGDALIELIESPDHDVGLYSVGMDVEDLAATVGELRARGADTVTDPVPTLVGSLAFLKDPNGATIALIEHH